MLDVHNQSAPISIMKLFTKTSHIHPYNTRSSKSQLFSTKCSRQKKKKKKKKKKAAFSRVGVEIWNKIPDEFKTSKNCFKKQMKTAFFRSWIMNILILMSKILPPNSKTAQLKQIDPITLVSSLLLYFIGTTIDVFTSSVSLYV